MGAVTDCPWAASGAEARAAARAGVACPAPAVAGPGDGLGGAAGGECERQDTAARTERRSMDIPLIM